MGEHSFVDVASKVIGAVGVLKELPRTGWLLRGVPSAVAETVAAHSFESAIIAFLLSLEFKRGCGLEVDPLKASLIALFHDIGEAYIGDIVKRASRLIGESVKDELELKVIEEEYGGSSPVYSIVKEYVSRESLEARVARLAESLSTLVQSYRYVASGYMAVCEILTSMYEKLRRDAEEFSSECVARLFELVDLLMERDDIFGKCYQVAGSPEVTEAR